MLTAPTTPPVTPKSGLSAVEAEKQRAAFGYNELPSAQPKSVWRIVIDVLKEPMLLLLLSCGTLYMLLGDFGEGIMLMASVLIVIAISFFQEKKTERALDELRDLSSPRALVIRDGKEQRIPGREVVPGDLVILQEGDRVPADAFVLSTTNLQTDESLLTGESEAVGKNVWNSTQKFESPSGSGRHCVYSGTLIVRGHGLAQVHATGLETEIGKIGKLLQDVKDEATLLQRETSRIVRTFSILGLGLCVLLIIIFGVTRGDWLNGVLSGLSLAMAMLPEEFAVVLTLFMALGAWRLSKKNVLTRKSASIETLGSVTVLCTDKTGTLTENRMTVRRLLANHQSFDAGKEKLNDSSVQELLRTALLAGQAEPFDPMEKAIVACAKDHLPEIPSLHLEKEYPLSPQLFAMSRVYQLSNGERLVTAKGAPEAIALLCGMNEADREKLNAQIADFAAEGLRVLGVATCAYTAKELPPHQQGFSFRFLGLVGMEDPLRATIAQDLASCYTAGIRVIMVTGDNPATAQHIARKMGLKNAEEVITGSELAEMDEPEIERRVKTCNIFARMVPEQKLLLVEALKDNHEIVAMTGDGVNDAPALRAANIGIAMGQRGTDVAREAADLVLLDDNFSSIIVAIRMGRRIYDNIRKAMTYIFAVHVPVAGLTLLPVLFPHLPVLLFPLHIAFLELIIDPASSLIFEAEDEERNIMQRPPAKVDQPVFGTARIFLGLLQGGLVLLLSIVVLLVATRVERPDEEARAFMFTTLIIANLGLIYINRSYTRSFFALLKEKNASVKYVVGGALLFLAIVLYVPGLRELFHFGMLNAAEVLFCFAAGVAGMLGFELIKLWRRNSHP